MSSWRLPTRLEVGGKAYPIHSDYRDILDILHRLNDASEPEFIRWRVALALFYEGDLPRSDYPEAMQKLADFLNCGQTLPRSPAPPLLDWEQDAPLIAAGINKAAGCEVRALPYLHWWTFMAWFNSIGDGQLATLLRVRSKLHHGQKLQPWEQDTDRKNKAWRGLRPRLGPAGGAARQRQPPLPPAPPHPPRQPKLPFRNFTSRNGCRLVLPKVPELRRLPPPAKAAALQQSKPQMPNRHSQVRRLY